MPKLMRLTVDNDGIAHLVLDNPDERMNTLSALFIEEFMDTLSKIEGDKSIRGLLLESAKPGVFVAGADIKWLQALKTPEDCRAFAAMAHAPFDRLENLPIPTAAVISGVCLGGGLELALACRWRLAADYKAVQVGLPEVKLGVLPGGGGTQRLPALVGIKNALELICAGKSLKAAEALKLGIVDALFPPDKLAASAADFLREKVRSGEDFRRPWNKEDYRYGVSEEEKSAAFRKKLFEVSRQMTLKQTKGHVRSPMKVIDAVEAGAEKGFRAGMQKEEDVFAEVLCSPEAKSLVDLFMMQNAMGKVYGSKDRSIKPAEIKKVGILGAGLMGSGIAHSIIAAGKKAVMKDVSDEALIRGVKTIQGILQQGVKKGRMTEDKAKGILSLLQTTTGYEEFRDVDMVIEAVFENMDLKQKTIREVEQYIPEHAVLASNTSSLAITELAKASKNPERMIGMHYFSPVNRMPLLEIIRGKQTAEKTIVTAVSVAHATRKLPIIVNDGYGFYTTRIVATYIIEALRCLEDGADVKSIDEALLEYGMPVGPITLMDEVGHDVGAHVLTVMKNVFPERFSDELTEVTVKDGRLGRKNGRGFFIYADGKKMDVDESVYALFKSRKGARLSKEEIRDRVVMNLLNEVGFCMGEGIVTEPLDAEMGLVFGMGFPPFRGGPLHAIDQMGAENAVKKLAELEAKWGPRFKAAPYLVSAAEEKRRLYS
ncbi:MAG: 3-hydroxyacyl-CoA dehydrogenase NAD-binding domain-containing protein [Syntrophales bacterium]|nr:3-hydroxyacyl-CoA dehydrogenase NAD-binding domain-containing protein [Syntrophales bacterium]MDD5234268.1 3-hydroxyacyl-CoA dehydrogenase NAD-binding domain-containing protein [Syntrophales bacterium]MDD5531798.1 3-hydroxyacyl-CoA dehydrogenase NAD-binding domain-containing protein [Syntrophales bacterium]